MIPISKFLPSSHSNDDGDCFDEITTINANLYTNPLHVFLNPFVVLVDLRKTSYVYGFSSSFCIRSSFAILYAYIFLVIL
jgi:hypothetical protein